MNLIFNMLWNIWLVLGEMAPYLILGFAIAGVLSVFTSAAWVTRHLGGKGIWPTIKATLLGIPLPLCSCGVIPVSASLRQQGASRGATTAFLLSTPQTGVDSILATYALLGPVFAIVRPVVALISGIFGGLLVDATDTPDTPQSEAHGLQSMGDDSSCCKKSEGSRFVRAVRYGFITLPHDIAISLIIGVVIAGALSAVIPKDFAATWLDGGIVAMLVMMIVGLPLYVCATGSIPLAMAFMYMGVSPGAALVFLITGPETNAATIAVIWKLLGKRTTVLYLWVVVVVALAAGFTIDWIDGWMSLGLPEVLQQEDGGKTVGLFSHLSATVLLMMLTGSFIFTRRSSTPTNQDTPPTTTLNIEGMTCSHCAAAVTKALRNLPGVTSVEVDLSKKQAYVYGEGSSEGGSGSFGGGSGGSGGVDVKALIQAVEQLGYRANV